MEEEEVVYSSFSSLDESRTTYFLFIGESDEKELAPPLFLLFFGTESPVSESG